MFRTFDLFNGRSQPAQSSSASAAVSTPSIYSVKISLTSNKTSDKRVIDLKAGHNLVIGRSSRSELKNLQPAPDNALFDCPVVSRVHAELRASPWDSPSKQITITDRSSLHGTTVNGLKLHPGHNFGLTSGDVIKLGERVTRGDDTHDGVSLTFHRIEDPATDPPLGRRFQVQVPSDDEASDIDDDHDNDDSASIHSGRRGPSSADTTPEQPRLKLGSQQQPINLEAMPSEPNHVIDLAVDDDNDVVIMPGPIQPVETLGITSTTDGDNIVVPDSVTDYAFNYQPIFMDAEEDALDINSDHESDAESIRLHNTGLSQILNHAPDREYDDDCDHISTSEPDPENSLDDAADEDAEDDASDAEHADMLSDSGASDLSDAVSEPDSYVPEENWSGRPLSPELGEVEQPQAPPQAVAYPQTVYPWSGSKDAWPHVDAAYVWPTTKPRYDPVRSSQPHVEEQPRNWMADSQGTPLPPPKATPFFTYPHVPTLPNPATDLSSSSRWDVPPAGLSAPLSFAETYVDDNGPKPHPNTFPHGAYALPAFELPPPPPPPHPPHPPHPPPPALSNTSMAMNTASLHLPPPTAASSVNVPVTKNKISITDIVEEPQPTEMVAEASQRVAEATGSTSEVSSSGPGKRKAEGIEAEEDPGNTRRCAKRAKASTTKDRARSRSISRGIASSVAHLVTGATVGVSAMMWFLNSDYSQRLVDWLA